MGQEHISGERRRIVLEELIELPYMIGRQDARGLLRVRL